MKNSALKKFISALLCAAILFSLVGCGKAVVPDPLKPLLVRQPFSRQPEAHASAASRFANEVPELPEETDPPLEPIDPELPGMLFLAEEYAEGTPSVFSAPGPVPVNSLIPVRVPMDRALASAGRFPDGMRLEAYQAFVYHVNTGKMVALRGDGQDIYPASVTKLLTILTALQYLDPEMEVTPGDEIYKPEKNSSLAYLTKAYTLTVRQLVEGMMIPSGNDASYVLSVNAARTALNDPELSTSECVDWMVARMNDYAEMLGMDSSHFSNVDGYWCYDHITTIEDMARLALAAYNCPAIRECCGIAEITETLLSGHSITWTNSNLMLDPTTEVYDERVKGMKTGSISGNNCLVAILEEDGEVYLTGVFGCPDKIGRYRDVLKILAWLFPEENEEVAE